MWAPARRRVAVEWEASSGRRGTRRLARRDDLWVGVVPEAGAGTRYAYRLDDDGPFPDPYSRALPEGVHGRSEVVDPAAFRWTDEGWPGLSADGLVVYELHVGTFTPEGTFDAVVPQLDELRALGVTAIELMPVASFPGRWNWGYDGVAPFAPADVYGGPDGLRRLVDAAHARGLGVLIDAVYNHLGPSGNYLRAFSPHYFTDRYSTPWGDALNYDGPQSRRVRDWAIDSATHWLVEYHADGLRLDATAEIHDNSPVHLLRELAARCRAAVDRPIVLIAEDERNDVRLVRPPARGGHGLDAVWADDFHHAVRTLLTDERAGYFADYSGRPGDVLAAVKHGFVYRGQPTRRDGRPRGRPTGGTPARAFVFCTENHDQVGNRAGGERLAHLVSPAAYRAASALLLFAPETPLLFMGQEFAASAPFQYFTDHDPELGRLVTEGRRREFASFPAFAEHPELVPDPQDPATFQRSKLDMAERKRHAEVYRLYHELLRLRREDPVLRRQDRRRVRTSVLGRRALAFSIGDRLVAANFGTRPLSRAFPAAGRLLLSTDEPRFGGLGRAVSLAHGRLTLPPETAALFALD